MIDLNPNHLSIVEGILAEHVPECEVRAFGSRATWNAKDYSDIDLAIVGEGPLDWRTLGRLKESFEESNLPMRVDVLDLHAISESFRNVIERDYVVVQERLKRTETGEWRDVRLGDVATIVMGQSPPGSTVSNDSGVPLLNGPTEFGPYHPHPVQFTTYPRKFAQPGDLLFCVRGSTTGRMNWADQEYAIGRGVAAIRHADDLTLQPVLRGAIEVSLPELLNVATGSTFPNVSASQIADIPYPDLSVNEQRAIAHVLGTLDDKIELNRRMNETLEAMARALFKSWFVVFEPVRAKMEGRWRQGESLPGLPADLYDLFPDRLAPSELGEIPEGWRVRRLDEIATFLNGLALQKYPAGDGDKLPVIKIAQLRAGHTKGADTASAGIPTKYVVHDGDVLFSWSGSLLLDFWCGGDGALNQHLFKVSSLEYPKWLYFHWVQRHLQEFRDIAADKATTMGHIQRRHLKEAATVVSDAVALNAMSQHMQPLLDLGLKLRVESLSLATQRDALLPGLVSGEVGMGVGSASDNKVISCTSGERELE